MAKDRKIDNVILGLLAHEKLTGYDIKKRIDGGISLFWKGSFGSIYPALASMEQDGLVAIDASTEEGREKKYYSITEKGLKVLTAWLEDDKAINDLKYETMLKVFFGGVTSREVTVKNINDFSRDIEGRLKLLRMYQESLSPSLDIQDHLYFYLTVTFGIATYEAYLKWCEDATRILLEQ